MPAGSRNLADCRHDTVGTRIITDLLSGLHCYTPKSRLTLFWGFGDFGDIVVTLDISC